MNMKMLAAMIVAILFAAVALPALAKPPDQFSDTYTEEPLMIADCGDFEVWTRGSQIVYDGMIHYDREGNPTRIITRWWSQDTFWNPDNGKEAAVEGKLFNTIDLPATGETVAMGIQFKLTLPGEGTLLVDVGRIVFDPFPTIVTAVGHHPYWLPEPGDFDKLCAYFAD